MSKSITHRGEAGYTLMELLVVLAILGLLTAIATPFALHYLETAKVKTSKNRGREPLRRPRHVQGRCRALSDHAGGTRRAPESAARC